MSDWLIIGYGNPLRGDDGLGCFVAEQIAAAPPSGVEVIVAHQLTPEMTLPISAAAHVIFVDASVEGQPGEIHIETVPNQPPSSNHAITHHFSPAALVWMAGKLFDHAPSATLITVTADNLDLGEGLSPPAVAAIPLVIERIQGMIQPDPDGSNASPTATFTPG